MVFGAASGYTVMDRFGLVSSDCRSARGEGIEGPPTD